MIFDPKPYIRTVPDWPEQGVLFRDITTLLANRVALRRTIDAFVKQFSEQEIDAIVGLDSRGFIIASPMAYQLDCGFVPIRKKGKLPFETISHTYELDCGIGEVELSAEAIKPGSKVVIVDDIIATGGTMLAACDLISALGGEVVTAAAVINLPDLGGGDAIEAKGIPVFTLCQYETALKAAPSLESVG